MTSHPGSGDFTLPLSDRISELEEDGVAPEMGSERSKGRVSWESLETREEEAEESPLCCGCNAGRST